MRQNVNGDKVILCGANSYERKFYMNPEFDALPEAIKQELQIMSVLYTEDVGGILTVVFDEQGKICFEISVESGDMRFDEIGSRLKNKELQQEKAELMQSLQTFYDVVYLGEEE